jgi:O-antigen/teichoic acid export membrane protein
LNPFRKLLGDTAIYGVSSIVGRFLNWWLVPYHAGIFGPEQYGVVSNLYSYVAFALIFLTYGMETGFFRFASRSEEPEKVYTTSLITLFCSSLLFAVLVGLFRDQLASMMQYPDHPEYIWWLALTVSIDAFTSIPFSRLRLQSRPVRFALIKIINIGFNIGFNVFFLSVCPWILKNHPGSPLLEIYNPDIGVGYVFIANLLASVSTLIMLGKELFNITFSFNRKILWEILSYSFPILVIGLAGMVNQNIDKILIPFLIPDEQNPMFQLGIYGANYKLAVLMNMFIQAFRYAFEPFFFARSSQETADNPQIYAIVMKYFILFGLIIFLGMVLYIDIVKMLIPPIYHQGTRVVPIILIADLFFGVFFSASIWYKLKDKTWYGASIAIIGAIITIVLNIVLIPVMGYMGSAIALLGCYGIMMAINYFWGQKFYPIPYDLKKIALYFSVAMSIYAASFVTSVQIPRIKFILHTLLFAGFWVIVLFSEKRELFVLLKKKKG